MQPHLDPSQTRSLGPLQQDLPPQVIIINNGGSSNKQADAQLRTYNTQKVKILGIIQIVAGSLCILLNIIDAIITDSSFNAWTISSGWWGAPFVVIAGALGVASSMYPVRRLVNCTLIFSIISCVVFIPMIVQGSLGIANSYDGSLVINSIFTVVAVVELVVSILQSFLSCSATCACCREMQQESNQTAQPMNVYYNSSAAEQQSNQMQLQQVPQQTAIQQSMAIQQQNVMPVVQQQNAGQLQQQQSAYPAQAGPPVIMTSPLALGANTPDVGQSYSLSSMGTGPSMGAAGSSSGLPGPSSGLSGHSSGLPGPSSGLPGPSSGFMYPENPPAYESITNNVNQAVAAVEPVDNMEQQANMDSKITEWAHREMQLSDNIEYRL